MNEDYKEALLSVRAALRGEDPRMSSMASSLFDDCRLLRQNPEFYGWERERIMRDVHYRLTRVVANLPYKQLYQLAIISKPSALWNMPSSICDTETNRRRLIAYAMCELMRKLVG